MSMTERASSAQGTERGVADLLTDLARHGAQLFRQELALATAEAAATVRGLGSAAAAVALAGLLLYATVLLLLAAATLALTQVLPPWAAALAVAAVTGLVGLIHLAKGRRDAERSARLPEQAWRSMRQDAALVRRRLP